MLDKLQKYAPIISFLLLASLVVALFFSPHSARLLSTIIIVFGIGTAILFTVHGNWETKKNDELTNAQFALNAAIDLLGLALIILSAMWLGRMAGGYVDSVFANLTGIIVAMIVGAAVAFAVQKVWGKSQNR